MVNSDKINEDLENNWIVIAEGIQNILRKEGYPNPYELLKDLTRNNKKINQNAQRYITDKIHEAFKLPEPVLQLGMTFEEIKSIQGVPQFIDTHTEKDQLFEMWTYPEGLEVSHLYFRDNMLIRIEK